MLDRGRLKGEGRRVARMALQNVMRPIGRSESRRSR